MTYDSNRPKFGLCAICGRKNDRISFQMCTPCAKKSATSALKWYRTHKVQIRQHHNKSSNASYWKHVERNRERQNEWYKVHRDDRLSYYAVHTKLPAFQLVSKCDIPKCVYCGCDDLRFLELNHKSGGGTKERDVYIGKDGKPRRSNPYLYYLILKGKRGIDDLEVVCKPHNAWHYLKTRYGAIADRLAIIWNRG